MQPPVKRGRGRPAFVPTEPDRELVKRAAAAGITDAQIALLLVHHDGLHAGKPIGERTMKRHFALELRRGRAEAHMNVGRSIYLNALQGNATLAIWYSKAQMGWRDPANYGVGPDGERGHPMQGAETLAAKLREAARAIKAIEDAPPPDFALVAGGDEAER
jgi:hypothetical protein